MNRRHAACLLGSAAVIALSAGCASSKASPVSSGLGAASTTASETASATASATPAATSSAAATDTAAGSGTTAVTTPTAGATDTTADPAGGTRKPCFHPSGMTGFLKLESADVDHGTTRLTITVMSCTVDVTDDEIVDYTPLHDARALLHAGARIQILTAPNALQTVNESWLVDNQLTNTPYFYYQENAQHQITAMQEIYHP